MRLSYDWLSDYVDLTGVSPQQVADKLTMGAFEVEEVRKVGPDIEGQIVVGEIVEITPHPNADKIRMTKVKVKSGEEPLSIVCGATNIFVGQRVPVALPGARVINRHDGTELVIKEAKIRGVASFGMLCSPPELGITAAESEGILSLNGDCQLGDDVKKLLHLFPDYVLHVEPRSNRGDALCVFGMAREVAALMKLPLKKVDWSLPGQENAGPFTVQIENQDDCPFFTIRLLYDLKMGPSPAYMVRRLEAIGVRTINNIVDVTNYILHEMGQPLHAYDQKKLDGNLLSVRRARKDEKLVTIDEKERVLNEEVLVIADSKQVVGIAGVMGGKGSEISEGTCNIALEAASFNHARVRRSSRLVGLSSDSSLRFERGVDLLSVKNASDRACHLLLEACGGKLGTLNCAGSDHVKPVSVSLRLSQVKRLAEIELNAKEAAEILKPLGFEGTVKSEDVVDFSVPSFRQRDVYREIDLLEEVVRLSGYDKIPSSLPRATGSPERLDSTANLVRQALAACGLNETWTSSLVGTAVEDAVYGEAVSVLNPLSPEHRVLRQSLLPNLIDAIAYNQNHGQHDVWLFETGRTYKKSGQPTHRETGSQEEYFVAGAICGANILSHWQENISAANASEYKAKSEAVVDFYTAKGIVERLFTTLGIGLQNIVFEAKENTPAWFHPGRACAIYSSLKNKQTNIGWLGEIHPAIAQDLSLRQQAYVFELSLDVLKQLKGSKRFVELFNTPVIARDLTVDVDFGQKQAEIADAIKKDGGDFLLSVELVSQFALSESVKSLSYRLSFQHPSETLKTEIVDQSLNKIRELLKTTFGASFRL